MILQLKERKAGNVDCNDQLMTGGGRNWKLETGPDSYRDWKLVIVTCRLEFSIFNPDSYRDQLSIVHYSTAPPFQSHPFSGETTYSCCITSIPV